MHGHYLPGYSLLSPELGAWLGVYAVLALSAVAAAALFGLIAQRVFSPAGARVAAGWFALGFCVGLLSGRVPYDLGFAIGLAAVLALLSDRVALALALALVTSLASPVAGAFLALAGVADALAGGWSDIIDTPAAPVGDGARTGDRARRRRRSRRSSCSRSPSPKAAGSRSRRPSSGRRSRGVLLIALLLAQGSLTPRARGWCARAPRCMRWR